MGSTENVGTTSQGSVSTVTPSRTSSTSTTGSAGASSADKTVPPPSKDSQQQNMSSQSSSSSLTDTSVETPSPPSILRSSPSFTLSPSSSQTRLSFAPLPEIAPRKRNSSMQLGVAARSRMIQQRRMMMQPQAPMTAEEFEDEYGYSPPLGYDPQIWNDERLRDPGLAEEAVDDAIAAFGRMMKDAGKTLWRKVSMKKLKEKDEADEEDPDAAEEDRRTELAKKARKKRAPRPAYAPVTNTQTPRVLSEKDENATTKRQPPLPAKPQESKPAKSSTPDQKAESESSSDTYRREISE
ncbi:hypothetical protein K474DRAFT_489665 [Panus rudis PR-1116 ss-1]|nr:hypothetical protein K474DRAFT_489665 [Panus rudis PR-1116 ss-1]